ncbi:MAG: hypothetical protein QGH20_00645 [Candidatus Latescibacteria bacterium]|jgi:O-acetyl-ADP-ribose deacetylase (regulator of RNase III)|nr:hypothetical protein [Candidatus Latescibacterota bacterium]
MRVGSTLIETVEGDICVQTTDAIVNAANTHLWMGAGVGGFPIVDCAETMIDVAIEHSTSSTTLELIRFVLLGDEAHQFFADILRAREADA